MNPKSPAQALSEQSEAIRIELLAHPANYFTAAQLLGLLQLSQWTRFGSSEETEQRLLDQLTLLKEQVARRGPLT